MLVSEADDRHSERLTPVEGGEEGVEGVGAD